MNTTTDQPTRSFPAHYVAAILALLGAVAVQLAWPEIIRREPGSSWWPLDIVVILAATGYLLATAELHWRARRWQTSEVVPRLWLLARAAVADLTIAVYMIVVLVRGPEASLFRSGLWIIPPTMLAVTLASAGVCGLALRSGWRRFFDDVPPESAPYGKPQSLALHTVTGIALLVSFLLIEYVEPQVKPWEVQTIESQPPADKPVSLHPSYYRELSRRPFRPGELHAQLRVGPV